MDTDLEFYTKALCQELRSAREAQSPEEKRVHERLAAAYRLQLQWVSLTPAAVHPELRLKPLPIAA